MTCWPRSCVTSAAAALTLIAGCSGSHIGGDAGQVLVAGRYELEIMPFSLHAWGVGPRLVLMRDGAFVGHGDSFVVSGEYPRECRGMLTAPETMTLTTALNDAEVLRMEDQFFCDMGSDQKEFHVTVRTDGGASNAFCYKPCDPLAGQPFDRVLDAAMAPFVRVAASGGCEGPVFEYAPGDPYDCSPFAGP